MKTKDFKQKYFTNNFYWVNKDNYLLLQKIAIEVGCICHTKKMEIIEWHKGFKNLGFRTYKENNDITIFQKEPFLLGNEIATDFDEMIDDYNRLEQTIPETVTKVKNCDTCAYKYQKYTVNSICNTGCRNYSLHKEYNQPTSEIVNDLKKVTDINPILNDFAKFDTFKQEIIENSESGRFWINKFKKDLQSYSLIQNYCNNKLNELKKKKTMSKINDMAIDSMNKEREWEQEAINHFKDIDPACHFHYDDKHLYRDGYVAGIRSQSAKGYWLEKVRKMLAENSINFSTEFFNKMYDEIFNEEE
jgi:hypothetical protein